MVPAYEISAMAEASIIRVTSTRSTPGSHPSASTNSPPARGPKPQPPRKTKQGGVFVGNARDLGVVWAGFSGPLKRSPPNPDLCKMRSLPWTSGSSLSLPGHFQEVGWLKDLRQLWTSWSLTALQLARSVQKSR